MSLVSVGTNQLLQLHLDRTAASSKYPICECFCRVHHIAIAFFTPSECIFPVRKVWFNSVFVQCSTILCPVLNNNKKISISQSLTQRLQTLRQLHQALADAYILLPGVYRNFINGRSNYLDTSEVQLPLCTQAEPERQFLNYPKAERSHLDYFQRRSLSAEVPAFLQGAPYTASDVCGVSDQGINRKVIKNFNV